MNRKGELSESLKTISGIVLGIGALLLVLVVLYSVFGVFFFGKEPDAETKQSMEGLKEALINLAGNGDYIFRFSKGYNMVVFEKGKGSYGSGNNFYTRPSSCFDDACIILCEDSENRNACMDSEQIVNLDLNGFITSNNNGVVYPIVTGNSKDEWLKLIFSKDNEKIKIDLSSS